jgi:hypothetical protein
MRVGRAAAIGLVIIAVAAGHAVLASQMRVPIIYADELGYIENARYLALGGARPALTYYPGLSVFLVPAWLVTTRALSVWRWALDVNIAAAVLTLLEVAALGRILGLNRVSRWLVALLVSAYPAVLLYSDTALSESLFQAVFLGLVLAVVVAARHPTRWSGWAGAGLAVAFLTLVHPRGLAVVVALVVVAALVIRRQPARRGATLGLAVGLVLGFGLVRVALVATRATNVVARTDYKAGAVVSRNLTGHNARDLVVGVFGRGFYLSLATVGLAPLAILLGLLALRALWSREHDDTSVIEGFVGLSAIGVGALSALQTSGGTRADQLVHGRYVDGVVPALLAVGLAAVLRDPRRRHWLWLATGLVTLGVCAAVVAVAGELDKLSSQLNAINILGIEAILRRVDHNQLRVWPLAAIGAGAILVVAVAARWAPRLAIVLIVVAFVVSGVDTQRNYFVTGTDSKGREVALAGAIQQATSRLHVPASCVSYDGLLDFNYFADRLLLGTQPLQEINPGQAPCGPFVITERPAFEQRFPGSRLVMSENAVDEDLYVLKGPVQQKLASAGWLLPQKIPGPLPTGNQVASIRTASRSYVVTAGTRRLVGAAVTNAGQVSPWPNYLGSKQTAYAVRVAVRWFATGVTTPVLSTAVDLPRSLLPGDTAHIRLPLIARTSAGRPLPAASYDVRVSVYQEQVHGAFGGAIDLRVQVTR